MEGAVLSTKNELDSIKLKVIYDSEMNELSEFIESGKTYKDLTVEEFKEEVKLFWKRGDIWKKALENSIYPNEKLDEDFNKIRIHAKSLLL